MRDLRYAARQLRKNPGFSLTVIATLGLCIGANTAIYSVVDATLFRPLPYPEPDRLAMLAVAVRSPKGEYTGYGQDGATWEAVRDHATSLDAAVLSGGSQGVNLVAGRQARYVQQERVSAGYFRVLGVKPMIGREFTEVEDKAGGPPVAILTYGLWKQLFEGDPAVVGRAIMLRGEPSTVVGVMPAEFRSAGETDVWTPLRPSATGEGGGINYEIIARRKPGVSLTAAEAQLQPIAAPIIRARGIPKDMTAQVRLMPLQNGVTDGFRSSLLVTWAAVGVVLLIGCVNIAGLLLARSSTRIREIATRMAVGAEPGVVVRQLLAESLLLALGGGVLGLLVGELGRRALQRLGAQGFHLWHPVELNLRVLVATIVLSVAASVIFGLAPALGTRRIDLRSALLEGGRGLSAARNTHSRQFLVIAEVALGLVLLTSAGLLLRTLTHLNGMNPGFDPRGIVTASLSLQDARYATAAKVNALYTQSLRRIRELPGVESAAVALTLPYERPLNSGFQLSDGRTYGTEMVYVTPGFFETLRIPSVDGRVFSDSDEAGSAPVAIVNRAFVRRFLRDGQPLGLSLRTGKVSRRIVGIVGDVPQHSGLGNFGPLSVTPTMYIPIAQTSDDFLKMVHTWFSPNWVVRTQGSPAAVMRQMQQALEAIDPQLPFSSFRLMDEVRAGSVKSQRYHAVLFSCMAALALLLAALGLYGLIAQSVAQRRREMGIRIALGAAPRSAIASIVRPGVGLALVGVVIGCALARMGSSWLGSMIYGVPATDVKTYAEVSLVLLTVALFASVLPALRILRLNPAETLREE